MLKHRAEEAGTGSHEPTQEAAGFDEASVDVGLAGVCEKCLLRESRFSVQMQPFRERIASRFSNKKCTCLLCP